MFRSYYNNLQWFLLEHALEQAWNTWNKLLDCSHGSQSVGLVCVVCFFLLTIIEGDPIWD